MAYMKSSNNHHELIQHRFSKLYIHLQRNQQKIIYDTYFELIGYVNFCYFEHNNDESYLYYIKLLFKMALFVRDYQFGMGERNIAYVLLCAWYKHNVIYFMNLYYFYLHTYGCWSDFKYFSQFIHDHQHEFGLSTRDIDFMVQHGISCVLFQFDKDVYKWNHMLNDYMNVKFNKHKSEHYSAFGLQRPNARKHISNVAKWIPREHKKYDWLYEEIVLFYHKIHFPSYFEKSCKYDANKWDKILSKWKMDFRKLVSSLNHELQTPQIKQCNEKWQNIDVQNISLVSLLKQKDGYYNHFSVEHEVFIQQYTAFDRFGDASRLNTSTKKTNMNLGFYVKEVLKLLKRKYDSKTEALLDLMEESWRKNVVDFYLRDRGVSLPYVYVFMDISSDNNENDKYDIIGNAIMLCMCSRNNQIFAIENEVHVLDFKSMSFVDIVRYLLINHYLQSIQSVNYDGVINFVNSSIGVIDCACNFVFLSNMKTCEMLCVPNLLNHKYIFTILWNVVSSYDIDHIVKEQTMNSYLCLNGSCGSVFHFLWKHLLKSANSGKNLQLNTYVYLNEILNLRHFFVQFMDSHQHVM